MSQRLSCIILVMIWIGIRILDPNPDQNYKVEYLRNYLTDLHEIFIPVSYTHLTLPTTSRV